MTDLSSPRGSVAGNPLCDLGGDACHTCENLNIHGAQNQDLSDLKCSESIPDDVKGSPRRRVRSVLPNSRDFSLSLWNRAYARLLHLYLCFSHLFILFFVPGGDNLVLNASRKQHVIQEFHRKTCPPAGESAKSRGIAEHFF